MPDTTLIVHGWSDCSASFAALKAHLVQNAVGSVETVLYADYESREDNVTFNDVVDGLHDEFIKHRIIDPSGRKLTDVNVIVHSTGGLVIRHWLTRYYPTQDSLSECPVRRIIMLAPANFGSPLAHRGKSLLGSLVKGRWKVGDLLEVGRQILGGLELGSRYQWLLAHRDLFSDTNYYAADAIQLTVLVGADDYQGLRGWVNKPGTDGTVVIAGAPLNSLKLSLDFTDQGRISWLERPTVSDHAFGVLARLDHGRIVKAVSDGTSEVSSIVMQALSTAGPADFELVKERCEQLREQTYSASSAYKQYQQFLVRVVDDQGEPVRDYTLEFYIRRLGVIEARGGDATDKGMSQPERWRSEAIQTAIMGETHTFEADPSHRRLLLCERDVLALLEDAAAKLNSPVVLCLRIHVPQIDDKIRYRTESLRHLVLARSDQRTEPRLFYPNTTTLVEMCVDRFTQYVTVRSEPRKH